MRNREKDYATHKAYIKRNPEKAKLYALKARLKRRGLSEEQYNKLLSDQGGVCALCKGPQTVRKDWSIDHNHTTGVIRALLCAHCNLMIGHARESIPILQQAILYLKDHNGE